MSVPDDLINFDLIETHKENIQQLPGGRSARQLATILSPQPTGKSITPSLDDTKTLNDAIRHEYEVEVQNIGDSDDPLDVYDRYVKWTLNAYPSAQATPQSQLLPLLERATKAFLTYSHYKNDPRYLKLWLHYIRWFSDAPREVFAYLARHSIGEALALFYEEFAGWLEGTGRWIQADEVYKLGVQREARPTERLMRKFGQFQQRFDARSQSADEPTSPALPTVRPALAAKIDPFASTPRPGDQPAPGTAAVGGGGGSTARHGKPKMAIFSDGADTPSASAAPCEGWQSIGSLRERKKENTVVAKPWVGETLKGGKRVGTAEKMTIFKDQTFRIQEGKPPNQRSNVPPPIVNSKTGRSELVFVDLEAVYPNPTDPSEEMSFDELRARHRGWTGRNRHSEDKRASQAISREDKCSPQQLLRTAVDQLAKDLTAKASVEDNESSQQSTPVGDGQSQVGTVRSARQKKLRIKEIRQETQTIKTNLASPTGPKIRRKLAAEPTMTFHSKAATDDVYDLFNQPLRCEVPKSDLQSGGESDADDDGYSTAGESTGTGIISGAVSETGKGDMSASPHTTMSRDENAAGMDTGSPDLRGEWTEVSPHTALTGDENVGTEVDATDIDSDWTDFSPSKHVPQHESNHGHHLEPNRLATEPFEMPPQEVFAKEELKTPVESEPQTTEATATTTTTTKFVPLPPEDYDPTPQRTYRDPTNTAPSRLPFMTPIVERTESSLAANTAYQKQQWDYFNSITPCQSSPVRNDSPSKVGMERLILTSPSSTKGLLPRSSVVGSESTQTQDPCSPSPKSKRSSTRELEGGLDSPTSPRKRIQITQSQDSPTRVKIQLSIPLGSPPVVTRNSGLFETPATLRAEAVNRQKPIVSDLQCNPTDASIRDQILSQSQPAVSSYRGFFSRPRQSSGKYTQLQRYAKRIQESKAKTSPRKSSVNGSDKTVTQLVPPMLSFPGASRVYAVKRELGRGAFASVYLVDSYDSERPLDTAFEETGETTHGVSSSSSSIRQQRFRREAVKAECPPSQTVWEFHIIRTIHARLLSDAFEGSSSSRQRALDSIIRAHECHAFVDEAYLVLDYAPTGTLLDLINTVKDSNQRAGKPEGGLDEVLAMFFAVEVLRTMEDLHRIGILHGDLKSDNCLLRLPLALLTKNHGNVNTAQLLHRHLVGPYSSSGADGWSDVGLKLIDLGRGIDVTAFPPRVGFIADWAAGAGATDAPEIREARPWVAQIDLWAAAGVLHSLLWGRYMETVHTVQAAQESGGGGRESHEPQALEREYPLINRTNRPGRRQHQYRLKHGFKRYWAADVWTPVFDLLLNPPAPPPLPPSVALSPSPPTPASSSSSPPAHAAAGGVATVNPAILSQLSHVRCGMEAWLETEGEKRGLRSLMVKRVGEIASAGIVAGGGGAGGG